MDRQTDRQTNQLLYPCACARGKYVLKSEQVTIIIDDKNLHIFHKIEELIIHNVALVKHVVPQPLNSLIMHAFPRYKTSMANTSKRALQHESGNCNILTTSVSSYSVR